MGCGMHGAAPSLSPVLSCVLFPLLDSKALTFSFLGSQLFTFPVKARPSLKGGWHGVWGGMSF